MPHAFFGSTPLQFRYRETAENRSGLIDVHIIKPGWGSSGYYSEPVLREACLAGVYPVGMHMHLDHPSPKEESDQPARTLKTLIGALTKAGFYETAGWDGPGVYAQAQVLPQYRDQVKEMQSYIGVSHYVDGIGENGTAPDGKRGKLITKLIPGPLNTVDLVTQPGAGGHFRTLFESMMRWTGSRSDEAPDILRAREIYRDALVDTGMPVDQADRLAEIDAPVANTVIDKAREKYIDTLLQTGTCRTREEAARISRFEIGES